MKNIINRYKRNAVLLVGLLLIFQAAMTVIFILKLHIIYFFAALILCNSAVILFLIFYLRRIKGFSSLKVTLNKEEVVNIMQSLEALIWLIYDIFIIFDKIHDTVNFRGQNIKGTSLLENTEGNIAHLINTAWKINKSCKHKEIQAIQTADIVVILQEINSLETSIPELSIGVKTELKSFGQRVLGLVDYNHTLINNTAKIMYNLEKSVPILSELSLNTNNYTEGMVRNLFEKFKSISTFSDNISQSSKETINSFIDINNTEGLAFISEETKGIVEKIEHFFTVISDLQKISGDFLESSFSQLEEIEETTNKINSIAGKIKLISINVRIEAARLGSKSGGFKVLGKEINDFAEVTSKIALETNTKINQTIASVNILKDDYLQEMNEVILNMENIKKNIEPFEMILRNAFEKIKVVVEDLNNFSGDISTLIKETVGNFQQYDLISQEIKNVVLYMNELMSFFNNLTQDLRIESTLSEEERRIILDYVINGFKGLIKTKNEAQIIEKYEKEYGVEKKQKPIEEEEIGEFEDGTILF